MRYRREVDCWIFKIRYYEEEIPKQKVPRSVVEELAATVQQETVSDWKSKL